jgi:predicted transglutaminase-like cysteine proteinase
MRNSGVILSIAAVLSFLPRNGVAGPSELYLGENVLAPIAHTIFCTTYPRECSKSEAAPSFFTVDPDVLYSTLDSVNREVNAAIRPAPADDKLREWTLFPSTGHCNDYVVSKRHELLKRGWPSSALQLAEIILKTGDHHLILVANARGNLFILDNLKFNPVPLTDSTEYHWVKIESSQDPGYWIRIRDRQIQARQKPLIQEVQRKSAPKWHDSMSAMLPDDEPVQSLRTPDDAVIGTPWADRWVDIGPSQSPLVARRVRIVQLSPPQIRADGHPARRPGVGIHRLRTDARDYRGLVPARPMIDQNQKDRR